jgi:regulator of sigma E protease
VSYLLAFLGFAALIILHEAGHFAAAKAVGMRVERFSLFFGPMVLRKQVGETEYGVGVIPLGGYVKISGMNPNEPLAPEVVPRAYYNQAVWKRIVVIAAGPAVNLLLAFVLLWALLLADGVLGGISPVVGALNSGSPAAHVLKLGDRIVSIDGVKGSPERLRRQIATHRCAGAQTDGCAAATPVVIAVRRHGRLLTLRARPIYDAKLRQPRPLLGFDFDLAHHTVGPIRAAGLSGSKLWQVTEATVSRIVTLFEPQDRRQLHGVVGSYRVTEQAVSQGTTATVGILALISLSLGVINLFPFLPLDGGHIFWALAEKVRGRRISFAVMERAGFVGFALILMLFVIGLSNDISHPLNLQ